MELNFGQLWIIITNFRAWSVSYVQTAANNKEANLKLTNDSSIILLLLLFNLQHRRPEQ